MGILESTDVTIPTDDAARFSKEFISIVDASDEPGGIRQNGKIAFFQRYPLAGWFGSGKVVRVIKTERKINFSIALQPKSYVRKGIESERESNK